MASRAPDKVQAGGVFLRRPLGLKKLREDQLKRAGQQTIREAPTVKVKGPRKQKSILQRSTQVRATTLKTKLTQKRATANRKEKEEAAAVKPITAKARTAKKPTNEKRNADITRISGTIKAKARAAAETAITVARGKVLETAKVKETAQSFSLKSRLENLNAQRTLVLTRSTQAETADTLKTLGSMHGTSANLLKASDSAIEGAKTTRGRAADDNDRVQKPAESDANIKINDAKLPDRKQDVDDGDAKVKDTKKKASDAGDDAEKARLAQAPLPDKIKAQIIKRDTTKTVTAANVDAKKGFAKAAGGTAAAQDSKRQTTRGDQGKQELVRQGHDSRRDGAAKDVVTHKQQISEADKRKLANEGALTTLQTTRGKEFARNKSDADIAAGDLNKKLGDAKDAASGPRTQEKTDSTKARDDKEKEITPNATAIKDKGEEIATAQGHQTKGKGDYDDRTREVGDIQGTLDIRNSTGASVKSDRDGALDFANQNTPRRPDSDQINTVRRSDIAQKDVPAENLKKKFAEEGITNANRDMATAKTSRGKNDTELAPMGGVRRDRVAEDSRLHGLLDSETAVNSTAHKKRNEEVAPDLVRKQADLQGKRRHMDELDSLITTRSLQEKAGVSIVTDASVTVRVSSTRYTAIEAGVKAGKKHAESAGDLKKTNDHVSDANGKLNDTGGDQITQKKIRDEMNIGIPREKANAAGLDGKRKEVPTRISDAKGGADIASGRIKSDREGVENAGGDLYMANDAFTYLNDPLKDAHATIAKNTDLGNAAGIVATKHRDIFMAAGDTGSKTRAKQEAADTGRKQSAEHIKTNTAAYDAAVLRKGADDTSLANIQKKHKEDIDRINANANTAVTKNKGDLDGATAMATILDPAATAATKKRSDTEKEVEVQGGTTVSKLGEVNAARRREGDAKKASDDADADVNDKQGKLNGFVGSESGLKADREKAFSDTEKVRPVRNPQDAPNRARKSLLDGTEIPALTTKRSKAKDANDEAAETVYGEGGLEEKRNIGSKDVDDIADVRNEFDITDGNLRRRRDTEEKKVDTLRESREAVGIDIMKANKSIQKRLNHADEIDNRIATLKLLGEPTVPTPSIGNIGVKQAVSSGMMISNGKKHAMSEGGLNASKDHIGRINDTIKDKSGTGIDLAKERNRVVTDISTENINRGKRKDDIDEGIINREGFKKKANDASKSAGDAAEGQADVRVRPGGIDDVDYYLGLASQGIGPDGIKMNRNKEIADAAGATADAANSRRNITASDAEKIKGQAADYNTKRKAENEHAASHQGAADAARAKKRIDDGNLDNVKKIIPDGDPVTTAKHKKDFDEANDAASAQYDGATGARRKREDSEKDAETNEKGISDKEKDVNKARENELAAKQKSDIDTAAVGKHQKDLDTANSQEGTFKKNRDDAAKDADGALPTRSPGDSAKKSRQGEVDGEVADVKKQKDDAERQAARDMDAADQAKTKKNDLPDPEDTKPLRDKDDDLQQKKKDEEENRDDLDADSNTNKRTIEQGELQMQARHAMVGIISGLITDLIYKRNPNLLPPPTPPYIIGEFKYPVDSPSGSVGPRPSGPAVPGGLILGPSGTVEILADVIDLSGMGDIDGLFEAPGASGASSSYKENYDRGKVVGAQDGARDATSDATEAYTNNQDKTIKTLEERIGMLSSVKQSVIDAQVTRESQDAYCKKVQEEGTAKKLDIYTVFSECSAYFEKTMPRASQPVMLEKIEPSSSTEYGEYGDQEGGYREDLSGVMQFDGVLTNSGPVVPTEENDAAYLAGYQVGYKKAYIQTYSLTIAIKITQRVKKEKNLTASAASIGYGEEIKGIITASMPITEASAKTPTNATGAVEGPVIRASAAVGGPMIRASGSSKTRVTEATAKSPTNATGAVTEASAKSPTNATGPVTEASAKSPTNATGPVTEASANSPTNATGAVTEASAAPPTNATGATEGGGFLKLAKRKYQRGKTLTQHAHLLDKIKDKTSVA